MPIPRKEQAQAESIAELRALYTKYYPKNPVTKREFWVKKISEARKRDF